MCPPEPGAESEICELDVAHLVDENIIRLNVPVDKSHLMNAVHRADKLTNVKPENIECKIIFINQ